MRTSGNAELDGFIDEYTPEIAELAYVLADRLKARIPGATIMGYNYYTALAIGWSPDDVTSHGFLSLALYPRWINLCFLRGVDLPDPHATLSGSGNQLRTIRITDCAMLDDPRIDTLIGEAIARSEPPVDQARRTQVIVKGRAPKVGARRPR